MGLGLRSIPSTLGSGSFRSVALSLLCYCCREPYAPIYAQPQCELHKAISCAAHIKSWCSFFCFSMCHHKGRSSRTKTSLITSAHYNPCVLGNDSINSKCLLHPCMSTQAGRQTTGWRCPCKAHNPLWSLPLRLNFVLLMILSAHCWTQPPP